MKPLVSIIIPTLDEAHMILPTLDAVAANGTPHDVIVVDGGSSDRTDELVQQRNASLIRATERSRAIQMNEGRRLAKGEALLFLHADTLIARVALARITNALRDRQIAGGAFARRYASGPYSYGRRVCLRNFAGRLSAGSLVIRRFSFGRKYSMHWVAFGSRRFLKTWIFPGE